MRNAHNLTTSEKQPTRLVADFNIRGNFLQACGISLSYLPIQRQRSGILVSMADTWKQPPPPRKVERDNFTPESPKLPKTYPLVQKVQNWQSF